jgi:hypothetical protein
VAALLADEIPKYPLKGLKLRFACLVPFASGRIEIASFAGKPVTLKMLINTFHDDGICLPMGSISTRKAVRSFAKSRTRAVSPYGGLASSVRRTASPSHRASCRNPVWQSLRGLDGNRSGGRTGGGRSRSFCLTGSQLSWISWACCSAFSHERVLAEIVLFFPSRSR